MATKQKAEKFMRVVDGAGRSHIMPDNERNRENIATMNQHAKNRDKVMTIHEYDPNNPDAPVSQTKGATAVVEQLAKKNQSLEQQNADLAARLAALEAKMASQTKSPTKGGGK